MQPDEEQIPKYQAIRDEACALAHWIIQTTPPGRERNLAITHLEEMVFWANAAVARHGI